MKNYTINPTGLREIEGWLAENFVDARGEPADVDMRCVLDFACDAEDGLNAGNPPIIELLFNQSATGRTITYTVSSAGYDVEEIED